MYRLYKNGIKGYEMINDSLNYEQLIDYLDFMILDKRSEDHLIVIEEREDEDIFVFSYRKKEDIQKYILFKENNKIKIKKK